MSKAWEFCFNVGFTIAIIEAVLLLHYSPAASTIVVLLTLAIALALRGARSR